LCNIHFKDFSSQIFYITQKILVGLASKNNSLSSKNDPSKMTWIEKENKNLQKLVWLELNILNLIEFFLWKSQIFSLQLILKGIFNFWL